MSQTVVFMEVNGVLYPDSLRYPDKELAVSITKEMVDDELIAPCDDYEICTEWHEIGDGESGMDTFFSNDTLVEWKKNDEFEKRAEDAGYDVQCIEKRTIFLSSEDVNEDDE